MGVPKHSQIFQALFIVRPDGVAAVHVESAVAPIHHVLDHNIIDFAFGFKHLEDFMAKRLFKVKFNLGSVPRDWFQTQSTGFFARRYAPFYAYLDPNPLFSLGEGQTSLLRSVFKAEYEYFRFLFEKLP
jgi:hypothetical protein